MTTSTPARPTAARRLPGAIYILALGTFCLGTSEFMLAGLLPQLSSSLHVSVGRAGLLITAFAVGMLLGAPLMTLATLRLPRRATMLGAAVVFAVAHLVPLLADNYAAVLVSRVVAAVACAAFWAMAAVIAARLAPVGTTSRAMAVVVGGLTLANVAGVPAGTWLGQHFGWRAAFVAVFVATLLVIVVLRASVPADTGASATTSTRALVRAESAAFRQRNLWLSLTTTALFQGAVFCCFSYLAVLLTGVSGIGDGKVPLILLLFGLGTFAGVTIGGRFADRNPLVSVLIGMTVMTFTLVALGLVAGSTVAAVIVVVLFGAAGFANAAGLNGRVFYLAGRAPTLAASVNVSAFNVGNAIGPWLGGLVISAGWGLRAPVWTAVVLAVAAVGVASVSFVLERRPAGAGDASAQVTDEIDGTATVDLAKRPARRPAVADEVGCEPACPA